MLCGLVVALTLAMAARAEDGTLLRYKWVEGQQMAWVWSSDQAGKTTVTDAGVAKIQDRKNHTTRTVYLRVEKVTPEGLAYLKLSYGVMASDNEDADGTKSHYEINPVDGTTVSDEGGKRTTSKRPVSAGELYLKGFMAVVDDRGQVQEVLGNDDLAKLVAGRPDAAKVLKRVATSALDMAPVLPEKAVKPGDEWEVDMEALESGMMSYAPGSKPIMARYRYEGEEQVGGVNCRRISMRVEGAAVDLVGEPKLNDGLASEVRLVQLRASGDGYLSIDDGLLWLSKWTSGVSVRAHVHGTQKTGDAEQKVDVSVTTENQTNMGEMKRL